MSSGMAGVVALSATAGLAGAIQAAVMGELGERVGTFPRSPSRSPSAWRVA
ncbi:MAG TPA: hypothetical protein VHI55_06465 [Gaiellaceae bacterium]|nr:hypothetical protein [Gaiellaceae bacterium]